MKTRVLSMILAIAMLFSLVIPAFAEEVESFAAEEPAAAEPVYEAPSVAAEPVQEIIPPAEEPVQEIIPPAEEPVQETVPVTEEPVQEAIPVEEGLAQENTPLEENPGQEADPTSDEPQNEVYPVADEQPQDSVTKEVFSDEEINAPLPEDDIEEQNDQEANLIVAFGMMDDGVAIDGVNFSDDMFRACIASFDTNPDGYLDGEEIEAVKEIDCRDSAISSLKGIEYFTFLEALFCDNNQLTNLDLEENSRLIHLECSGNYLTYLNVTSCTELRTLVCKNNQLTTLDLRNCGNLRTLVLNLNNLTNLDVSNCPNLEELMFAVDSNNPGITGIDLSNCPNLVRLNLDGNQVTTLDLSHNTALKEFRCGYNHTWSSLDVSYCPDLAILDCRNGSLANLNISNCVKLRYLIGGGNMATLDIRDCPILENTYANGEMATGEYDVTYSNGEGNLLSISKNTELLTNATRPVSEKYSVDIQSITATESSATFELIFGAPVPEDGWGYNVGVRFLPVSELPSDFSGGEEWYNSDFRWRAITGIYDSAPEGTVVTVTQPDLLPGTEYFVQAYISVYEDDNGENNYQIYGTLNRFSTESIAGEIPLTEESFPDEAFRNYISNNFDTDANGTLSEEEITAVTTINGNELGIASLEGINIFSSLQTLSCYSNQLTTIDLKDNTALRGIWCQGNQIGELDLSGMTNLEVVRCDNNGMTSLNLNGCTALTSVMCYYNALTNLDLSGCTALTYLQCNTNALEELNLNDCIYLTCLYAAGNQLTVLDLNSNLAVQEAFENNIDIESSLGPGVKGLRYDADGDGYYYGPEDRMISVDETVELLWPGNDPARGVRVNVTNFPDDIFRSYVTASFDTDADGYLNEEEVFAAKEINIDDSGIATLQGIEHLYRLERLFCSRNQLTNLDLSANTVLGHIECTGNGLTSIDVSNCRELRHLIAGGNQLTAIDVSNCGYLKSLILNGNSGITSIDVRNCPDLETLEFGGSSVSSLDVSNCQELIRLNCAGNQLTELDLSNNMALETLRCFNMPTLITLDVSNHTALKELDCKDGALTSLNVSGCSSLGTLNVSNNPNLSSLEINSNPALAELRCQGTAIATLDIRNCPILKDTYVNGQMEEGDNDVLYYIEGSSWLNINKGTELIANEEEAIFKEQLAYALEHPDEYVEIIVDENIRLSGTIDIPENVGLGIKAQLTLQPNANVIVNGSIGILEGGSLIVSQGASLAMADERGIISLQGGTMHVYGELTLATSTCIYVYTRDYGDWYSAAAAVADVPAQNVRMILRISSSDELDNATEFASGYGNAEIYVQGTSITSAMLPDSTVQHNIVLRLEDNARLVISGGNTLTVNGSIIPGQGCELTNYGTLQLYGHIILSEENTVYNEGVLNIYNANSIGPYGVIQNEGIINLLGGSMYQMITITGNGTLNDLNDHIEDLMNIARLRATLEGSDDGENWNRTEALICGQYGRIVLETKNGEKLPAELFTYESSDEAIAKTDENGTIETFDTEGTATISITVKVLGSNNGRIDVTVEVEKPDDEPITLELVEGIIRTEQGYLLSKIYQPEGVLGAEYTLKPQDSDLKKGMYKYTATDTKVAAVKENADGTATVTLKGQGETTITIAPAAKTDSRTPVTVTVRVRDYTPRLGETAVTLNPKLDMEATLPLTAADGSSITDVQLTTTAPVTCEYADGQLVFTTKEDRNAADKKAVLTVSVEVVEVKEDGTTETYSYSYTSDGKNFPYLSVTTKGTEPSITVKQTGKINTFYMDSETTLTVTAKNEEIVGIELAGNPTYEKIGSYGDVITLGIRGDYETLDTKSVDLKIFLAGYKEPVTKTVAVSAEHKGPTLTVSPASGTIDPTKGEAEIALTIFNKTTGQDIDVGKLAEPYIDGVSFVTAAVRDEDTNTIRLTLDKSQIGKGGTVKIGIREAADTELSTGWTTPVEVSYKIAVKEVKAPKLKLGATTLTVSSTFNANEAGTSFGTDVADIPVIGMSAEYTGKDAAEAEKLALWYDPENRMLKAAVLDQSIKTGSYKYNIVADTDYAEGLKATVTVKVADTMPKVSFAKASLTLNASLAGKETAGTQVKLSTKSGYSVVGFSGIDASADLDFDYDVDSATLYVKLKHGTAGKYSWTLTPLVEDDVTGQTEEGKAITLTVTSAAKTASVKAAGKGSIELIARSGSGITYTPTLTNALGTVTGAYLPNESDRKLFTLSSDVNEKGTATAILRLKDEATVDVKTKYPVTIAFEVDYGAYELTTTVTPTLKQSTAKFGKTAVATVFQGTANPTATYEVTITGPEGAAISNIAMDSKSMAATLKNAIKGITWSADGASATVVVSFKNMATLKSGSTYKIPLIVTPAGSGAITKANVTLSFKVNR